MTDLEFLRELELGLEILVDMLDLLGFLNQV